MKLFIQLMLLSAIILNPVLNATKWEHKKPLEEYEPQDALALLQLINAKRIAVGKPALVIFSTSVLNGTCGKTLLLGCSDCEVAALENKAASHENCAKVVITHPGTHPGELASQQTEIAYITFEKPQSEIPYATTGTN